MPADPKVPIENISDTARWVAYYRAMETQRPDAIFRDPYAERLAGAHGRDIVDTLKLGRDMAWPMIVRTAVLDEMILEVIKSRGADLVVNLAAGLDARPWRMALPSDLRWVDVDLPGILNYKTEMLANEQPKCRYEAVTLDLRERAARQALFSQLGRDAQRALVISEGLLVYLTPQQVTELSTDIHAVPSFRWWTFDLGNPWVLKLMKRQWGKVTTAGNAEFKFAPAEGPDYFVPQGWRVVTARAMMPEALRLDRFMKMTWLMRCFTAITPPKMKKQIENATRFVLLERD
jgi:methyltransferase (TIGR00027 family)